MIAHVAKADEARGRVLLSVTCDVHRAAGAIAVDVAAAFDAELEVLLIDDGEVCASASLGFLEETTADGRRTSPLTPAHTDHAFDVLGRDVVRRVRALSLERDIRCSTTRTLGVPSDAIASACAARGPWNIVVEGSVLSAMTTPSRAADMAGRKDATGTIVMGPNKPHDVNRRGAVVVLLERSRDLAGMIRTAMQLSRTYTGDIVLMLVTGRDQHEPREIDDLITDVRRGLREDQLDLPEMRVATPRNLHGEPAAILHAANAFEPSIIVTRQDGPLQPDDDGLNAIRRYATCPVLVGHPL